MAKIQYMVTEEYVQNWTVLEALREVLSNGVDAEVQQSAPLNVRHDARKKILYVRNDRAKLDVKALYFGGTNKSGDTRLIGQFGEGLKLALLVFARTNTPVTIRNGDEDWSVAMEDDDRGVRVLTLYTRKARTPNSGVEVEVGNVTSDLWEQAQNLFLRLLPPLNQFVGEHGEILTDPERVGNYYVRGVFVTHQINAAFGYNFKHLEVGRDRRSYDANSAQYEVSKLWGEVVTKHDVSEVLFRAMRDNAQDMSGFKWYSEPAVIDQMVRRFKALYGEKAIPVKGTAESDMIAHLGYKGVVLPDALVTCLRQGMPSIETLRTAFAQEVKERFTLDDLTAVERGNFIGALDVVKAIGHDLSSRVIVARFGDETIMGLHNKEGIFVSRAVTAKFGETLVTLIHELAHDVGKDGSIGHVGAAERLTAMAYDVLRARKDH